MSRWNDRGLSRHWTAGGKKKKVFLVGSDYVYPRTANFIAKKYLKSKGLKPVGEAHRPLGDRDFTAIVKQIQSSGADCVLNTVNGDSNLGLFTALAAARIDPAKVPVVSTSIAEDELRSLLPEHVQGHYAASRYFQSLDTEANRRWVRGFRDEFGFDRVTGDLLEPGWCLVHLWKQAEGMRWVRVDLDDDDVRAERDALNHLTGAIDMDVPLPSLFSDESLLRPR